MKSIFTSVLLIICVGVFSCKDAHDSKKQYAFDKYIEQNKKFIEVCERHDIDSMTYYMGTADAYWDMYTKLPE